MTPSERYSLGEVALWSGALVASGLMWWYYAGLFRWLAELQLRLFGAYSVQLAALGTLALLALPARHLLGRAGVLDGPTRSLPWLSSHRVLLAAGAIAVVVGAWLHWDAARMVLESVTAVSLQAGGEPASRWLAVEGIIVPELALCKRRSGGRAQECYVPVVSEDWTPEAPIAAILKTGCGTDELPLSGSFAGTISYTGMPGHVQAAYERSQATLHPKFVVIDWNEGPESVRTAAYFFWGTGVLFGLMSLADWHRGRAR